MTYRSASWFADTGKTGIVARSHMLGSGLDSNAFDGRPVIGICNTWSQLTPCNGNLRDLAAIVAQGVIAAGGLPLEFPVMSLGEPLMRPTTMLHRNLLSIDVEETLRSNPLDGVVLLSGCDKTTPALLMGAASVDLPTILLTSGPMISGSFRGAPVGSGTDTWRMNEELRSGRISREDFDEFETCLARSTGHCMTMGTASTMACLAEALGIMLPGGATPSAIDASRIRLARKTGETAVALVRGDVRLSQILTHDAFHNAVVALSAIGGSTNAVIHLLALAGRCGVPLSLSDIDRWARDVPVVVDLKPTGQYLMQDLADAGGFPAVLAVIEPLLRLGANSVAGVTLGEITTAARPLTPSPAIRTLSDPVRPAGHGVAVLSGSLAPDGSVIKISAASPELLTHRGPARVFDSLEEYLAVAGDPDEAFTGDEVLILRNAGPRGWPGMPEVGNLPLPVSVLATGQSDMVRVTDARMSGTAEGTVVLHVAPESAAGGPLALVRNGDDVHLDVPNRRLDVFPRDGELTDRSPAPARSMTPRGWTSLYVDHVMQADTGADLDFLVGGSGHEVPRTSL